MCDPVPPKPTDSPLVVDWLDELIRKKEEEQTPLKPLTPPPPVYHHHLGRGCPDDDFREED